MHSHLHFKSSVLCQPSKPRQGFAAFAKFPSPVQRILLVEQTADVAHGSSLELNSTSVGWVKNKTKKKIAQIL